MSEGRNEILEILFQFLFTNHYTFKYEENSCLSPLKWFTFEFHTFLYYSLLEYNIHEVRKCDCFLTQPYTTLQIININGEIYEGVTGVLIKKRFEGATNYWVVRFVLTKNNSARDYWLNFAQIKFRCFHFYRSSPFDNVAMLRSISEMAIWYCYIFLEVKKKQK